jgi:hypothetical protein
MTTLYEEFVRALEFLVSIEPDPEQLALQAVREDTDDMTLYRALMKRHEAAINNANATIRAYGTQIAPKGLVYMQKQLYDVVAIDWSAQRQSVMVSATNTLWNGIGEWRT